jgi:hypothetical protein
VNTTHVAGTAQTAKDLGALNVTTVNTLAGHDPGETIMGATDLGTGAGFTSLASASALSTLQGNVTTLLARVTSTLFDGITSLAEWLGLLAGKQTGDSTALSEIKATGAGSGTYDPTTDSQEAIRDRGDAAWLTATGFSTTDPLDAAGVRAAVGLASANLDTQLAALPTDADVNAQVDAALADYDAPTKAELDTAVATLATALALSTADGKIDTLTTRLGAPADFGGGQSIAANLQDMVGSATYDPSTDSLESLRDRGDAAWATADVSDLATAASVAALPSAADVADAVWDETAADHDTEGSTGAALADAGGAGTPPTAAEIADAVWDEALSDHTDDGSAGDTLGSVATGTPPTAAAIADAVLDEALSGHASAGTLGKAVSDTATAAAAIQTKTDNLPASPAATGAAMTLTAAYDAAKTAAQAGDAMALTSGERTTLAGVVWAALTSALTTAGSIGKKLAGLVLGSDDKVVVSADAHTSGETVAAVAGAVGSVTGNVGGSVASVTGDVGGDVVGTIGGLSTQAKADVNAEADSAVSDAALATAANLATAKTAIDAVKAKTDNPPTRRPRAEKWQPRYPMSA